MKYILYVQRMDTITGGFHTQYSIPLDGCFEEDNAIMLAKRVKASLKDNYVVAISRIKEQHVCYVIKGEAK